MVAIILFALICALALGAWFHLKIADSFKDQIFSPADDAEDVDSSSWPS